MGTQLSAGSERTLIHHGPLPGGEFRIPLGLAYVKREGGDVTLIAYGPTVADSMNAANMLAEKGVSAEVVDLRSLTPLDGATMLESVGKTRRAVITHRATDFLGPASEISAFLHRELFGKLKAPVSRVADALHV